MEYLKFVLKYSIWVNVLYFPPLLLLNWHFIFIQCHNTSLFTSTAIGKTPHSWIFFTFYLSSSVIFSVKYNWFRSSLPEALNVVWEPYLHWQKYNIYGEILNPLIGRKGSKHSNFHHQAADKKKLLSVLRKPDHFYYSLKISVLPNMLLLWALLMPRYLSRRILTTVVQNLTVWSNSCI